MDSEGAGAGVVDGITEGCFCWRPFSGLDAAAAAAAGVALRRAAGFVILAIEPRCPAAVD